VDVVQEVVAVLDAQRLADTRAGDARYVEAGALVDFDRPRRDGRRRGKLSLELHEHVPHRVAVADEKRFVHRTLAGMGGGAHRVHAHPDDLVAGLFAGKRNAAFDGAAFGGGTDTDTYTDRAEGGGRRAEREEQSGNEP